MIAATKQVNAAAPVFEKGQVWMMKDRHLRVRHVGKRLVEFKLFKESQDMNLQRRSRTSLETVEFVRSFLQAHKAVLK